METYNNELDDGQHYRCKDMTNLKAVNVGMNRFCGPAVLSILTGKSTDECAKVITQVNGNYNIAGVQLSDLLKAANKLGFDNILAPSGSSLFGTLIRLANEDGMYIITVPNHFVVIEVKDKKAYFCDNHTKEPIPAESSARLGQKVLAAHKVTRRAEPPPKPEPKLLMIDYNVQLTSLGIYIDKVWLYENPDDNKKEQIGSFQANDENEFCKVIRVLREELN